MFLNLLEVSGQHNSLDLQPTRRKLADKGVADGADGQLVEERPHNHDAAGGQGALAPVRLGDQAQEAQDEEHAAETAETIQIQRAAADAQRHQAPCAKDADHVDGVLAQGKRVRVMRGQAGLLEEVGGVVGEGVAAEVLDGPGHAHNLGAAAVDALEAVPVGGAGGDLLLERGGVDHHGHGLVGVKVGLAVQAGQAQQRLLGLLGLAAADQPPGRLGRKVDGDEERQGPHPLQAVRDAVCPLVVALQHGVDDADANLLAEAPAEVDVGGQVAAQGDGAHFRGVRDSDGLEDAPGDAAQDLGDQQRLDVGRGEEDGREGGDQDEAAHDGFAVAKSLGDEAVDEEADDFTDGGTLRFGPQALASCSRRRMFGRKNVRYSSQIATWLGPGIFHWETAHRISG